MGSPSHRELSTVSYERLCMKMNLSLHGAVEFLLTRVAIHPFRGGSFTLSTLTSMVYRTEDHRFNLRTLNLCFTFWIGKWSSNVEDLSLDRWFSSLWAHTAETKHPFKENMAGLEEEKLQERREEQGRVVLITHSYQYFILGTRCRSRYNGTTILALCFRRQPYVSGDTSGQT